MLTGLGLGMKGSDDKLNGFSFRVLEFGGLVKAVRHGFVAAS